MPDPIKPHLDAASAETLLPRPHSKRAILLVTLAGILSSLLLAVQLTPLQEISTNSPAAGVTQANPLGQPYSNLAYQPGPSPEEGVEICSQGGVHQHLAAQLVPVQYPVFRLVGPQTGKIQNGPLHLANYQFIDSTGKITPVKNQQLLRQILNTLGLSRQ